MKFTHNPVLVKNGTAFNHSNLFWNQKIVNYFLMDHFIFETRL